MKNERMSSKAEAIFRTVFGAPIGLTICILITVFVSIGIGDGNYYPVVPKLIEATGSEMNAVLVQMIVSLAYGAVFGGASMIWKTDWSLLKQTLTHLVIVSCVTFPVAWFMNWMPHKAIAVILYYGLFFAIYAAIWLINYVAVSRKIRRFNEKIQENQ